MFFYLVFLSKTSIHNKISIKNRVLRFFKPALNNFIYPITTYVNFGQTVRFQFKQFQNSIVKYQTLHFHKLAPMWNVQPYEIQLKSGPKCVLSYNIETSGFKTCSFRSLIYDCLFYTFGNLHYCRRVVNDIT